VAPTGKAIPAGTRITITDRKGVSSAGSSPTTAPPVPSQLLARGSRGEEVKTLQDRLQDLGYYQDTMDGDFGSATDAAVRAFQADAFSSAEADGKVGPKTWAKLWRSSPPVPATTTAGVAGKTYLRLTKSNSRDQDGLYILHLDYIKNGIVQGTLRSLHNWPAISCSLISLAAARTTMLSRARGVKTASRMA
jgi:lysozyme